VAEQIADLQRLKSQATEEINSREIMIQSVMEQLKKETEIYTKIYLTNKQEMMIRKNDLAVFQFMMQLVKCKSAGLLQAETRREARICESGDGFVLSFGDAKTQAEVARRMTPAARLAVNEVLAHVSAEQAEDAAGVLHSAARRAAGDDDEFGEDAATTKAGARALLASLGVEARDDATTTTTTTMGMPTPPVQKTRVAKDPPSSDGSFKCPRGPPDCGLLHDKMSLMWGKFKDLVDELQHEMDKNEFEFEELKINMNQQLDILKFGKAKFIQQLSETTANIIGDVEEMKQLEDERNHLEHEYKEHMHDCRKRIHSMRILHLDM
jgi:hypothetical protein